MVLLLLGPLQAPTGLFRARDTSRHRPTQQTWSQACWSDTRAHDLLFLTLTKIRDACFGLRNSLFLRVLCRMFQNKKVQKIKEVQKNHDIINFLDFFGPYKMIKWRVRIRTNYITSRNIIIITNLTWPHLSLTNLRSYENFEKTAGAYQLVLDGKSYRAPRVNLSHQGNS